MWVTTLGCRVGRVGGCVGVCRSGVFLGLGFTWVGFTWRGWFMVTWLWVVVVVVTGCVGLGFCRLLGGEVGRGVGGAFGGGGGLGSILLNLVMNFRIELVGWSWLQVRRRCLVIVGFCCWLLSLGLIGWVVRVFVPLVLLSMIGGFPPSMVFNVFIWSGLYSKVRFSGLARSLSFSFFTTASTISAMAGGWWGCWPTKFSTFFKIIPNFSEPLPFLTTASS